MGTPGSHAARRQHTSASRLRGTGLSHWPEGNQLKIAVMFIMTLNRPMDSSIGFRWPEIYMLSICSAQACHWHSHHCRARRSHLEAARGWPALRALRVGAVAAPPIKHGELVGTHPSVWQSACIPAVDLHSAVWHPWWPAGRLAPLQLAPSCGDGGRGGIGTGQKALGGGGAAAQRGRTWAAALASICSLALKTAPGCQLVVSQVEGGMGSTSQGGGCQQPRRAVVQAA